MKGGISLDSETRRQKMIELLKKQNAPISGNQLAEQFGVTRQVIVKDMGMIKAGGLPLLATAKGYLLQKETDGLYRREIQVRHSREQIGDEMRLIVDLGGYILNTHVDHPIYGSVGESIRIRSRRDIQNFLAKSEETGCMPLLELTNGIHSHTIAAEDEQTLDEICEELRNAGYLLV